MTHYVACSTCGKRVSNYVDQEIIVRAYIECPECIDSEPVSEQPKLPE